MELKSKIYILIAVVVTAFITYNATKTFSGKYEAIGKTSDTTSTVETKYSYTQNNFSSVEAARIKKVAIDSLSALHRKEILNLLAKLAPELQPGKDVLPDKVQEKPDADSVYASTVYKIFTAKDSIGKTTDSLKVTSKFISLERLPEKSIHAIEIEQYALHKETKKETTINTTITVEKKKTFFDRLFENFSIKPAVVAGYDIINKKVGVTVGIGISVGL